MKKIVFICLSILILSCKKDNSEDFPNREYNNFGTISITVDSSRTSAPKYYDVDFKIMSIGIAPIGSNGKLLTIYAWNGLTEVDCKQFIVEVWIPENDPLVANKQTSATIRYNEGQSTVLGMPRYALNSSIPFVEFLPSFLTPLDSYKNGTLLSFDRINLTGAAESRNLSCQITDEIVLKNTVMKNYTFNEIKISNIRINGTSFGKMPFSSLNLNTITFDANDVASGSMIQTATRLPAQRYGGTKGKPGIDKFKCEFANDGQNELQSIEFEFTHYDNQLAYGRVGKQFLNTSATDFTEIKIKAVGHDGKIYNHQDNMGFVQNRYEYTYSDNGYTYLTGSIALEFEFDLIALDGSSMKIRNGVGVFSTTR